MSQRYNLRARTTTPVYNPLKKESDTFIIKKKKKQISTSKLHPYENLGYVSQNELITQTFNTPCNIGVEIKNYLQTFRLLIKEDSVCNNTQIDNWIEQINENMEDFSRMEDIMEEFLYHRISQPFIRGPRILYLGDEIIRSLHERCKRMIEAMQTSKFVVDKGINTGITESYIEIRQHILAIETYLLLAAKYKFACSKDSEIIKSLLKNLQYIWDKTEEMEKKYKRLKIRESDIKNVKILHNTVLPTDVCNYVIKNFL